MYAVIADVHGNYPALKAVLDDAKRAGAEQYLLAGDYITDFPYTREIFEALRDLPGAVLVSGNREWYMGHLDPAQRRLEQFSSLFLTEEVLGKDGLAWVRALPRSVTLKTPDGGKTMLLEHVCEEINGRLHADPGTWKLSSGTLNQAFPDRAATRREVTEFARGFFEGNPALSDLWDRSGADVVLHGHSHLQYALEADGVLYLNPGSCGSPCDQRPGAPYTLLRYENGRFAVEERRVEYDIERAVEEYRRSETYRQAPSWSEMVIHAVETGRDFTRVLFRFLEEEQEKSRPKTDAEHNEAFRRAFLRTEKTWEA